MKLSPDDSLGDRNSEDAMYSLNRQILNVYCAPGALGDGGVDRRAARSTSEVRKR